MEAEKNELLRMEFCDATVSRSDFLHNIRIRVMVFTGEGMGLDALINEIAKNIWDHANKEGELIITKKAEAFEFSIRDFGTEAFDYAHCAAHSTKAGNGINFGVGLKGQIPDIAKGLGIDLKIDTSRGFKYSGVYVRGKGFSYHP